jgi:hypothetical protein
MDQQSQRQFSVASARLQSQQNIVSDLATRSIRRFAGRAGVELSDDETRVLAQRVLSARPEEAKAVVRQVISDIAQGSPEVRAKLAEEAATLRPAPLDLTEPLKTARTQASRSAVDAARRVEPVPEKAIADAVAARPKDELTRLKQEIADLERIEASIAPEATAAPTAPRSAGTEKSEVIGREEFLSPHRDEKGIADMGAASDALAARVKSALDEGRAVTFYAEGKAVPIVAVERGMMKDPAGQRWGTMMLATDKAGSTRVEIAPKTTAATRRQGETAEAPVDPIEARGAAAERAVFCLSRGL